MNELTVLVNRIKIATDDDRKAVALDSMHTFDLKLQDLEGSCSGCHKDEGSMARIFDGRKKQL